MMKFCIPTYWPLLFFFINSYLVFGQQEKIDSLKQVFNATDNDFQKENIILLLADAYLGVDSLKGFRNAKRAYDFFQKERDTLGLAKANSIIGKLNFYYGSPLKAESNYKKALNFYDKLMKRDSSIELMQAYIDCSFNLGSSYGNQGKLDEELKVFLALTPMVNKIKDYKTLALMNTNLGIGYYNNQKSERAYEYLINSPKIYAKINKPKYYAQDRLVFAACLASMDSLKQMKNVLDETKITLKRIGKSGPWHVFYRIQGEYFNDTKQYQLAIDTYDKCRAVIKNQKIKGFLPGLLLNYAETYEATGNIQMAKKSLFELNELKEELSLGKLLGLKKLSLLEEKDNKPSNALKYLKEYNRINDSINSAEIAEETARLEQLYQKEKKDREIAELQVKNERTDLDLEKKKSQNYLLFILLGSLLFVSIAGYLTYNNRQKKALLKEQAQAQEIQQLKVAQERKLFGVMMEGVEQERKRLAADLHDGLGGRLSGISIKLSRLAENKKAETLLPHLDDVLGNLDDSLQELRGVARNLMPETLLKYGLKAAVEDYCSTLGDKETNITLQFYNTEKTTDKNELLTVYRIIQELINNAIKHAKATEVLVQCIVSDTKIDITIEDDGRGFDVSNTTKNMGLGLTSLKNRVDYLNGIMDIRSEINEGTSINIQIEKT